MFRFIGLYAVIPATLLLTVSFFILVVLRKIESQALKVFAYVIIALLWFSTLLVLSLGIYTMSTGRHPMAGMMQKMMRGKGHGMMMEHSMPAMKH